MQRFSFIFFLSLLLELSSGADIIASMQSIINGETLVSSGQRFELGFFSPGAEIPVAQLLESGNFVVREKANTNPESYIWQSFDFPSDTQLPGMKMGWNFKTGVNRVLTSWKNATDPSKGEFTYKFDNFGLPQLVFARDQRRSFALVCGMDYDLVVSLVNMNAVFKPIIVYDNDELYYVYEANVNSVVTRVALTEISKRPICECLKGFVPKQQKEWDVLNWTGGCVRRTPLTCHKEEGFLKLEECLKNCSCTAYANSDIRNGGSGCLMWFGDLIDIREFIDEKGEQDVYIREPASELGM
uniref:Bulb-type lectin domain-containing protein n=1 Tax=Fagus sylvatica TaxID=28930 RepID=A0A2N9EM72_FAGSY